jgi:hypothetical protein
LLSVRIYSQRDFLLQDFPAAVFLSCATYLAHLFLDLEVIKQRYICMCALRKPNKIERVWEGVPCSMFHLNFDETYFLSSLKDHGYSFWVRIRLVQRMAFFT